ncbi:MAG: MptD family putative ECF transporter S component [Coriobacteriales bacterium]|jgi:energy-coupling factor transport system substrate-specific component|nr:MptD family putative ECF transporter S component [Coriobacteriales bacterium]
MAAKETEGHAAKARTRKSRALVSAGVFIALYFVVFMVFGVLCMPVPVLYLVMPGLIALFAAPIYRMLVAKAPMHGPVLIAALLPALFLMLQGNIWIVGLTAVVAGVSAEVVLGIVRFKGKAGTMASYLLFTQNLWGGFLPIWIMRDFFFEKSAGMGGEFVEVLMALTPTWVLFAQLGLVAVCAFVGFVLAGRLFKKHFEKAGVV